MTSKQARRTSHPALAWLLAFALIFAQGLGLAHRVQHAPGVTAGEELFGLHHSADCLLYDQLAHGDALVAALPVLPPVHLLPAASLPVAMGRSIEAPAPRSRGPPPRL